MKCLAPTLQIRFVMLLQTKVPKNVNIDHTALYSLFDSLNNIMLEYAEEKKWPLHLTCSTSAILL